MGVSSSASAQSAYSGRFGSGGMFGSGPFASRQPTTGVDTRDFSITPMVGLQETVTDNALLTPTNQKFDIITRPMVGADVNLQGGPAVASLTAHAYYDAYASQSQLSGFSADAQGTGSYTIVPNFLAIDGDVLLTNTNVSNFGTPVLDRIGNSNRVMLTTYDIGPRLTTTVDNFADLAVVGRFAQVFFGNPNNSTAGLPNDSTILQGAASLDTAKRFLGYQATTTAMVERDDHGFQAYNVQQSFFVGIFPQVRVIARGGYDDVQQTGVVNISAPMWSGGLEYTINEKSKISIETGERYNHSAWAGQLELQLTQGLTATGRYFEAIQPDQLQINSSFVSFITPTTPGSQLPAQVIGNNFTFNGNLDNQTTLNKEGDFHLAYNWETQTIGIGATWNDRQYLTITGHDRSLVTEVDYERSIAADLSFGASINYLRTFSNPFYGASELYGGNIGLQYDMNSTMRAMGGYAYQRQAQMLTPGQGITENVLYAAIAKRF